MHLSLLRHRYETLICKELLLHTLYNLLLQYWHVPYHLQSILFSYCPYLHQP
jgi:hypothetical protein